MRRRFFFKEKVKQRLFRSVSCSSVLNSLRRFTGKVVIITGSSSGIGQSAAFSFAEEGASVVIHGQNKERLDKTEKLLLAEGIPPQKLLKVLGSLEDPKTADKIIRETINKFGRIDILINNAGVLAKQNISNPESIENLDYIYQINLRSVILLTQLALPYIEKVKGNVVSVSSTISVRYALANYYALLKAGIDHWTRAMAVQYGPKGVRFNAINPGATKTIIFEKNGFTGELKKLHERWVKKTTPLGRFGEVNEMAAALKFLASDEATYITGVCLMVDGGWSIASVGMDQI
ncbi:hypothetical protein Mgra_00003461 [Meloidogyne graminicola]|uniref:Uncharacterized protein n=1 Tax=Meloidogyne graminicola TaxID=189291 RepID=A0A8S9ZUY9_9BILA|nr:hypothetical protein Mgra_00003461 [Meloidogyne graminicola]